MSVLPPDVNAALAQLLQGLQSADNIIRSHAEESLNSEWVVVRPGVLLMGLVEQMRDAQDTTSRSFASVLFRRIATRTIKSPDAEVSEDLFWSLQEAEKVPIRDQLLVCLSSETETTVRHKVGDAVAEVARQYTAIDNGWPELLNGLFHASQSTDIGMRETAFRIFSTTPDIIEKQHEQAVLSVFAAGFKDGDLSVRLAAMEAFASFFSCIGKKSQQKYFALLPEVLSILPAVKASNDNEKLTRALIALIELAEIAPKMFKPMFHDLLIFSISVIKDKELEDQARQNALELMATFADHYPAMCKKDPDYTDEMVTQCLSLMTDVGADDDDCVDWNESEDLDADESDMNHVAGEQCMDRLANKLGGQTLLPPTFKWLLRMMGSTGWRDRHAALMAISAISEGCRAEMVGELAQVLELVLPALKDPNPRVRWAGCNALGQMSTDFAGTMQEQYHQIVLPAIIPVLQCAEPRVQSHAAAALVNFCEEAEKEVLEPYLDELLNRLLSLLQSNKRFVQEQALSTIATIADSAEAAFSRYYDTLMPLLFNVLKEEQSKEYRLLRAKAMECATLIALAVGKDQMGEDGIHLVNLLGNIQGKGYDRLLMATTFRLTRSQGNITEADDPQASYLLHCWGRMCRVLGQDFLPYLPSVIPPLMTQASAKADIQLLDDEEQVAQMENEEGWELVPLKGKFIGIKTTTLDDKHTAIELIAVYAQYLEAAFEPYVLEIMEKIAIPSLEFFFHDPVRVAAARVIPQLLNAYKKAHGDNSPQVATLWTRTIEKIFGVLGTEPAVETLAAMYQCFYESVEIMGKDCLTPAHMSAFVTSAQAVLEEYQTRFKDRHEEMAANGPGVNGEEDAEEEDEDLMIAIEDDQTLLADMNKAFHATLKNHTPGFLAYWDQLIPFYDTFINSSDATQRQWALCIYDDLLEFCGPRSWAYHEHIINPLLAGIRDDAPANRQAAAYGPGVAAQHGGDQWSDFLAHVLPMLFEACQRSDAREDDHIYATENCCASIAKILKFNNTKVLDAQAVARSWLDTLPIIHDEEAAPFAYLFLAELIESHSAATSDPAQTQKIFAAIALALEAETIQGQTANRVVAAAKALVQQTGVDAAQVVAGLSLDTQKAVQAWFS